MTMTGSIELRRALRVWRRRPSAALTAVLTLGLTLGAVVAVFGIARRLVFEPLPYHEPERLVALYTRFPSLGFDRFWLSGPEAVELGAWARSYDAVAIWTTDSVDVLGERPVRARLAAVNADSWRVWGVDARLGRTFGAAEDVPGAAPVAVLAHGFWRRALAADPGAVGRTVRVDGQAVTVVGVMPPGFDLLRQGVDLWVPLGLDAADPGPRPGHFLNAAARLAPGVGAASADAELTALMVRWQSELGEQHAPHPDHHPLFLVPLHEDLVADLRPHLATLATAALLLFGIAGVNLLGLRLAEAEARRHEAASRLALGAGLRGILVPFLVEGVCVAIPGAVLALLVALAMAPVAGSAFPHSGVAEGPRLAEAGLAFGLALLLAAAALTPWPWLIGSRRRLMPRPGSRVTADRRAGRLFRLAIGLQVALATALVASAAAAFGWLGDLSPDDPGYAVDGLLTVELALPEAAYLEDHQVEAFYAQLLDRLRSLPGVTAAAAAGSLPPERVRTGNNALFETLQLAEEAPPASIAYTDLVTADWLRTLDIPVLRGRGFTAADERAARPVTLISRSTARAFWGDRDPLGDRFREGLPGDEDPTWFTIVGIVEDLAPPPGHDPGLEAYFLAPSTSTIFGEPLRNRFVVVRTQGDPASLAPAVRREVARLDPALAVAAVRGMDEVIAEALGRPRLVAGLSGACAALALSLAGLGLHAGLRQGLAARRHEMAVRWSFGASRPRLARALLLAPLAWAAGGLATGILLGAAAHRLLAALATELPAARPWALLVAALVVAAATTSAAATALPGLRRLDAGSTLRVD